MKETIEILVPLSPFLLGLLALLIPSAADRLKFKSDATARNRAGVEAVEAPPSPPPLIQGKTVDFTDRYLSEIDRRDAEQEAKISELKQKLANCTCGASHS